MGEEQWILLRRPGASAAPSCADTATAKGAQQTMKLPSMFQPPAAQRNTSPSSRPTLSPALHDTLSQALGLPTRRRRPLHFPFSLANQPINAPRRIAPALLQPFVEQR